MSILVNNSNITEPIIISRIDVSFQEDDDENDYQQEEEEEQNEYNGILIKREIDLLNKNILYQKQQQPTEQDQIGSNDSEYLINTTTKSTSFIRSSSVNSYIKTPDNSDDENEQIEQDINNNAHLSIIDDNDESYSLILRDKKFNIKEVEEQEDITEEEEEEENEEEENKFETITLESSQERKQKESQELTEKQQHQPSPFKKLITQKFKSFKDLQTFSPPIIDKYNTFPLGGLQSKLSYESSSSPQTSIIISTGSIGISSSSSSNITPQFSDIISQSSAISYINTPKNISPSFNNIIETTASQNHIIKITQTPPRNTDDGGNITLQHSSHLTRPVLESEMTKVNNKILVLLSLSIFFSVSNLYYTQPLLNDLGLEFGVSNGILSLVPMSVQLGYSLGLLFISTFSDIISKKKLILLLSILTSASLIGVGLSPHISQMVIFYFFVGLTTIIPNIAIPMAVDMTNAGDRRSILSILVSSLFVGLLGARVISGIIGHLFGWRVVFYVAASSTFIVSISLFILLPYTPRTSSPIPYKVIMSSILRSFRADQELRASYFIGMCIFATFSILWTTLSFRLGLEPFNYSSGFIGLFGLIGMAGAITPISSKLSERFNLFNLVTFYMLICASGYLIMFFFDSHLLALIAGIFILDLGVQSVHISNQSRESTTLQQLQDDQMKARINQAFLSSYFIGGALGSGISGIIFMQYAWKGSSILGLVFIGLALSCHLIFFTKDTSSIQQQSKNHNNYIELDETQ